MVCVGLGVTWMKTVRVKGSSTRLDRLRAMRSVIWLARRGGGPRVGATFEVYGQSVGRLRAAARLVCGFGAEWCMSERRLRSRRCVFVAFGGLVSFGRRLPSLVRFSAMFSL